MSGLDDLRSAGLKMDDLPRYDQTNIAEACDKRVNSYRAEQPEAFPTNIDADQPFHSSV
jgi:hypothetical protein